jgi:hypothetical protein
MDSSTNTDVIVKVDQSCRNFLCDYSVEVVLGKERPLRNDRRRVEVRKEITVIHDIDPGRYDLKKLGVKELSRCKIRGLLDYSRSDEPDVPAPIEDSSHNIFLIICFIENNGRVGTWNYSI